MKTKFTLLIIAGLFFAASIQAQDRDRQYDRNADYGYKTRMHELEQKLNFEMNELGRARECGNWEKARHEKNEIAEIRDEMRHVNYHRWSDQQNDFNRNHHYNSRF
jgi:hypothetical protein